MCDHGSNACEGNLARDSSEVLLLCSLFGLPNWHHVVLREPEDDDEAEASAYPPPVMRGTYPRDFGHQRRAATALDKPESLV